MMLKDPYLNEDFDPRLMWFVGVFGVYDREETLGVELEVYNPDESADREILIRRYCLNLPYLSYRHKFILIDSLYCKLQLPDYDFQSVFEIDIWEAASWPRGEWYCLQDPRGFFKEVYRLACEVWAGDLAKAAEEDPSTW
ncbi:hypothetical protein [Pseudomonas botevensis]|uniref:hypothetical protein n=1 Tax=Pseudomonas botevensis TaxID=2842352 RepID=UPI001C3D0635|nr:hypothetical protein [Pseudomonas botevensis]MBV4477994.1 hypothetical protein [Pseudomonas botevensis]